MSGSKGSHGGARIGAGRKPKHALELVATGNPGRHRSVSTGPGDAVPAPIVTFAPPADLSVDERAVWQQLAPQAFAARTLTPATAFAFELLVRNVVLERERAKASAGSVDHRGLVRLVENALAAFSLRPFGKPIYEAAPPQPQNPLDKFLRRDRP